MLRQITRCRECEWSVPEDELEMCEHASLACEHAIAAGHEIETVGTELSHEEVISAFFQ